MDRSFLITDDNGLGRVIFFSVITTASLYLFWLLLFVKVDDKTIIIILFLLFIFIFLICRNIYYSRKIIVNCREKMIFIRSILTKINNMQIPFQEIKVILFFEKEEIVADYGKHWQKFIKIIGKKNNILYESKVSRIFNYQLLTESCHEYFNIDYIVEKFDDD